MDRVQVTFEAPKELVDNVKKALEVNGYTNIEELTQKLWNEWLEKHSWCLVDQRFHCPTPTYALHNCKVGGPMCSYLKTRYLQNPKLVTKNVGLDSKSDL
jgi:hypothetical protein